MESGNNGGLLFACEESGKSVKGAVGCFSGALSSSSESYVYACEVLRGGCWGGGVDVGVGLRISPDFRGGGGSGGPRDLGGAVKLTVCVRRGGAIIFGFSSFASESGRPWSKDRRTGTSGGAGRCNCTLFRRSVVSFPRLAGKTGRSSWVSPFLCELLAGGDARLGGAFAILESVVGRFAATA